MVDDMTLAREAQLVYSRTPGFNPIGSSLTQWRGQIPGRGRSAGQTFVFDLYLPEYYPNVPPVVRAITAMRHPNISEDGFVSLRILDTWRADFHLYQVIQSLESLMMRAPPTLIKEPAKPAAKAPETERLAATPTSPPAPSPTAAELREMEIMRDEMERMRKEISEQREQITKAETRQALGLSSTPAAETDKEAEEISVDPLTELESEEIATSELLASLHDRFTAGEVSFPEYARLHKKYSKELFLTKRKREHMQSK
ncbi:MAG: ubiquitin-conjugating enzyme E2 variant [Promethearchaeota archaeon]